MHSAVGISWTAPSTVPPVPPVRTAATRHQRRERQREQHARPRQPRSRQPALRRAAPAARPRGTSAAAGQRRCRPSVRPAQTHCVARRAPSQGASSSRTRPPIARPQAGLRVIDADDARGHAEPARQREQLVVVRPHPDRLRARTAPAGRAAAARSRERRAARHPCTARDRRWRAAPSAICFGSIPGRDSSVPRAPWTPPTSPSPEPPSRRA